MGRDDHLKNLESFRGFAGDSWGFLGKDWKYF